MTAQAQILDMTSLDPEWERIEILAHCLTAGRRGEQIPEALLDALRRAQDAVTRLRAGPGPWRRLQAPAMSGLELDVLAALAAPEVSPRVGWLYQTLQAGAPRPYASPALLQDLLAARDGEAAALRAALRPGGRLARLGLIAVPEDDRYQPIRIEARALDRLMGWPTEDPPPPGATPVPLGARWDDLVLSPQHRRMLEEFLIWVRHRDTVMGSWGGQEVGGPIALFSGPSGTGKTFAALVIATELGWPLHRVDLGLLVSKYIGETEKNVNRLLDAAHGRPMVLQFDEADSLLGKRGEVKEARDRYANMEVSHLLSRLELHRGPCILTTNLRGHVDQAFLRRFQIIVEFPRPDAAARARLWARLLPPKAPLRGDVEPEALGKAVNLTGGSIRNAALHAAFLAAEANAPIGLDHIAIAVWRELGKANRPVARSELGELADHLPAGTDPTMVAA